MERETTTGQYEQLSFRRTIYITNGDNVLNKSGRRGIRTFRSTLGLQRRGHRTRVVVKISRNLGELVTKSQNWFDNLRFETLPCPVQTE